MFNCNLAVQRRLAFGLTVAGFAAGAVFGVALTVFGKIVAGAPPATLGNYLWNADVFGGLAGLVSPVVSWSARRSVPFRLSRAHPSTAIANVSPGDMTRR